MEKITILQECPENLVKVYGTPNGIPTTTLKMGLQSEKTIIELSKTNLRLRLSGGFLLIVLSFWLLTLNLDKVESGSRYSNPTVMVIGVLALIVIMLFFSYAHIKLLLDKSPGMVINAEGITDNAHASAYGFIPWADVTGVVRFKVHKHWHVAILVTDPDKYLTGNMFVNSKRKSHLKATGTTIAIPADNLQINHEALYELLLNWYTTQKTTTDHSYPACR